MSTISQIIKYRNRRKYEEDHQPWLKAGLIISIFICIIAAVGSVAVFWAYTNVTRDLPPVDVLSSLIEPPNGAFSQPTRLYDRDHEHLLLTLIDLAVVNKRYLHVDQDRPDNEQFSKYLVDATIAVYDPGFWHHAGYSLAGWSTGAHPTIAQWLVGNLVLIDESPSIKRNLQERILAAQITATYSRNKVIEWYLNSTQYGYLIYGADAAALKYFGKSASSISLAEAALLTAIGETPAISPSSISGLLKDRQRQVLQAMITSDFITQEEAIDAIKENIQLKGTTENKPIAPEFTGLTLEQLSHVIPLERLARGGYDITTTLDYDLQMQTDCLASAQANRIAGKPHALSLNGINCEAEKYLPAFSGEGENPFELQSEVIVINPASGQILSLDGGATSGMSPSAPPQHPSGTILAPFLYLAAFAQGKSPGTLLWDIPGEDENLAANASQNSGSTIFEQAYHGPVSARTALVNDYFAASAEMLAMVGIQNVWQTEKQFGINIPIEKPSSEPSLSEIYSQKDSLLDIAGAYAVLANQGIMAGHLIQNANSQGDVEQLKLTSILRVIDPVGKVVVDWSSPRTMPIVSPQLAYLTTHILSDEKARESGLNLLSSIVIDSQTASKVGITSSGMDAWTVGYLPDTLVGVWTGSSQEISTTIAADIPTGLWHAVMEYASQKVPAHDFNIPSGINIVQVCYPSGLLVSSICPSIIQEVYLSGNEPTEIDNLYQEIMIDRESGYLATLFTPFDLIEKKIFLVVPPKAVSWANDSGIPLLPETYDPIPQALPVNPDVHITAPQMFDNVRGKVNIYGTATGKDFLYYRLQVGQGLYPQRWLQIGENITAPVQNGLLGTWDTQGAEGVYIIELLVVRQDKKVDQDMIQVFIDDKLPDVVIIGPMQDSRKFYSPGESIMLNVSASDNAAVSKVEFYVDGNLVSTLLEPPYVILWPEKPGEHTFMAKAYDLAGNIATSATRFYIDRK